MLPIHSFQYLQLSKDYEQNMGDTKQLEIIIQQLFYQKPKEKKKSIRIQKQLTQLHYQ